MWDVFEFERFRRSGGGPTTDQGLVAAEDFHESPRQRPIWLVFAFYALMIAIGVWLLATEIADPDEQPAVAPTLSPVVVESLI